MASSEKAIVKDPIYVMAGSGCVMADCGEYTVDRQCDCVRLHKVDGASALTLSHDAFIQHLNEGRIAFIA